MGVIICIQMKESGTVSKVMLSLILQYTINLNMLINMVYAMFRIET